jgi:Nuclease-related domain
MAQMMSKTNHLQDKYRSYRMKSGLSFLGVFLFWIMHVPLQEPIITMPGFLICGVIGAYFSKQAKVLRAGVQGEKNTSQLLSHLPENCYVFNDMKIEVAGKTSEIDSIVVSPYGICIIETKNHKGEIFGKLENQNWTQRKTGRKGGSYKKTMYNPVKQVKTHTWRLSQLLKENGLHVWVKSAVYFSNRSTTVFIDTSSDNDVPVFSYKESEELLRYVLSDSKKPFNQEQMNKVISVLKQVS